MRQPTNREIKWALRAAMPSLDWKHVRVYRRERVFWRAFAAKREGIKYTVEVLSQLPLTKQADKIEYALFVDETCVLAFKDADYPKFLSQCRVAIKKLSNKAQDRANKLSDVANAAG